MPRSIVLDEQFFRRRFDRGVLDLRGFDYLTDVHLQHLQGLSGLWKASFSGANIEGPGLQHLAHAEQLIDLSLVDTQITDEGIKQMPGLNALQELNLTGNQNLTDKGLEALKQLTSLRVLCLNRTGFRGPGFAHLSLLPRLEELYLCQTALTDAGLACIRAMPALQVLHLHRTLITDAGLSALAPLQKLRVLNVAGTGVTDAGLSSLSCLPALEELHLAGRKITEKALPVLANRDAFPALKQVHFIATKIYRRTSQKFERALGERVGFTGHQKSEM